MLLLLAACTPATVELGGRPPAGDTGAGFEVVPADPDADTGKDSGPGDSGGDTAPPAEDPDLYVGDEIMELSLTLSQASLRALQRDGRSYAPATLGWDSRAWEVEIHIKGSSSWQSIDDKPSLVVDVNRDVPGQEFRGAKKLYLHNDCYDPSQMSETLAYGLYRAWGFPASRTSFAHLTLNGEDYGLYTVTEPHNDDFLQAWFADPNGNLYENGEAYCDVTDVSCMEVEESDEGSDEALRRFGQAARERGDAWRAAMEPLLDWPRFIDALAFEAAIAHWDSYSYDLSNYQLYHEPSVDHWTLLTQSMDLDFGYRPWSYPDCGEYGMDPDGYTMGMLAASCHADASCLAEVVARIGEVADLLEAADGAAQVRALDARIGAAVKADPRRYWSDRDYDDHVACLQQFFADRPAQLRAWVAEHGGQ